ncbi:MAG: SdpI family protein [Chitinophagales bacterium]|nr:SdpI family protein [Chitinophagales bacterium]
MSIEIFLGTGIAVLVFVIFLIAGLISYCFPSKNINSYYGYRTPRSQKNQTNWDFAQKMSGKVVIVFAFIQLILLSLLSLILIHFQIAIDSIIPFQMILMVMLAIVMLIICERKLENFDKVNTIPL